MRRSAWRAALPLLLGLAACTSDGGGSAGGRVRVVTTVSPITNILSNIGGDRVRITGIVPEGENSHQFEPRPSDARVMAQADVVFVNGLHLEEPTLKLAEANIRSGVKIVRLGDRTITPAEYIYDFSFPKEQGDPNPHLWTHPLHAKRYAEIARDELKLLDPEGGAGFDRNYLSFAARIDALDAALHTVTNTIPEANRKLLTYHDSFPYFARAYGWKVIGAVQPSDFAEPKPREVAQLIRQIRAQKVPAIFGSEVFPSKVLEQIAKESGARYVDKLRDDDLPGSKGDRNHSFLGLLVFDFSTIVGALGGQAALLDSIPVNNVNDESNATYRE
ncbi:MAG: metal ABC transporter substrate-binding protein [Actinomycetota bacterium]